MARKKVRGRNRPCSDFSLELPTTTSTTLCPGGIPSTPGGIVTCSSSSSSSSRSSSSSSSNLHLISNAYKKTCEIDTGASIGISNSQIVPLLQHFPWTSNSSTSNCRSNSSNFNYYYSTISRLPLGIPRALHTKPRRQGALWGTSHRGPLDPDQRWFSESHVLAV